MKDILSSAHIPYYGEDQKDEKKSKPVDKK